MVSKVNSKNLSLYLVFAFGLFVMGSYYAVQMQNFQTSSVQTEITGNAVSLAVLENDFSDSSMNLSLDKKAGLTLVFFLLMVFTARIALAVFEMGHRKYNGGSK